MEEESKQSIEKKKLLNSNYIIININTSNTLKMFIVSWSNALHIREQFKLIHNPDMKASAKHFRVYAPHAHDTQTKLKVFRSSALALNKIDNLDIPFNSPELLIFSKVTARHCLRIFVNSRVVTCSGVTTSRATSEERRKEWNTSGQRGNKINNSCRDISVVVAENNSVVKPKC